ncbi:hypothetical protein T484DRAFT_1819609 [Baffinella frigidus]|nr:hypothetical protein T484DRAFT_1819609 [Cryptophyta sp. CCMP2293]
MLARKSLSLLAPASRRAVAAAGSRAIHLPSREAKDSRWGKTAEDFERVQKIFKQHRACAVLRTPTAEAAPKAMQAAVDGGFKIVEFTLTTPGCLDSLTNFRAKHGSNVMVGCGTIMDIEDCQNALDAGSEFIVAPVFVPEVVNWCRERNVVIIPGCTTPSELYAAYKVETFRIFEGACQERSSEERLWNGVRLALLGADLTVEPFWLY